MYIKKTVIQRLIDDVKFRERLAVTLGVTGQAIYTMAKRYCDSPFPNSNFTRIVVIQFFVSEDYSQDYFLVHDLSAV